MYSASIEDRQVILTDKLTKGLDSFFGQGSMSSSIYDTAWISLIKKKSSDDVMCWLFPQSFQYILNQQQEDGGWVSYASQIDGILNTAASLLATIRHWKDPLQLQSPDPDDLQVRIAKGSTALQSLLSSWDVDRTVHVGFEILVPALLDYLKDEGFEYNFSQQSTLQALNQQKLSKFQPIYLYTPVKTTALHSLEAFIGKVDFDRLAHHKYKGSFMASPSSTAAYLMNSSRWDDECEEYLRYTLAFGAGRKDGSVPSAFPSSIFELTWV